MQFEIYRDYIYKWHRIRQAISSEYIYVETLYTLSQ